MYTFDSTSLHTSTRLPVGVSISHRLDPDFGVRQNGGPGVGSGKEVRTEDHSTGKGTETISEESSRCPEVSGSRVGPPENRRSSSVEPTYLNL